MRQRILLFLMGAAVAGCNSNPTTDDSGTDGPSSIIDLCDAFSGVGTSCPKVSATVCFNQCNDDGCKCVSSPDGAVWECTTDLSCRPCSGPLDDASADCGTDASDAGLTPDASDDAADAGD